jgi:hypothetical protein
MSVATLTAAAQAFAASAVADADSQLDAAEAQIAQIGWTALSFSGANLPAAPTLPDDLEAPSLQQIALDAPDEPDTELVFQDISAIELDAAPTFEAVAPTLAMPSKPSELAAFTAALPTITTDFDFPEAPDALLNPLIDAPVLPTRTEPTAPQVALPSFDAIAPTDVPEAPTDLRGTFETEYANAGPSTIAMLDGYVDAYIERFAPEFHTQMAAIEAKLTTYLAGGTGLDATVETAIYERSRTKQDAEARRVRDAAYADAAANGFTLPPGMLQASVRRARQAGADNLAQSAREIVVLQAELEQKNLQWAVGMSADLRKTLLASALSYHQNLVTINGQAIEYAKSVVGMIVEAYNVAARAFGVQLEAYKAEAQVYDTRLKAALAGIEVYKIEVQALEALTNIDRATVEVYKARIDALQAYASVHKARVDAVVSEAQLEKLKLDLFGAQVQEFGARAAAKRDEWLAYRAGIDGEQAKVQLYQVQAQVHASRMQGFRIEVDAKAEVVRAQAITNQARAENFRAVWGGYTATVQARGEVARTALENQRQQIIAFQAETQAQVANFKVKSDYYQSAAAIAIKNSELSINALVQSANMQTQYGAIVAKLYQANQNVHAMQAQAALAGMNTLASQSLSE